MSAPFIRLGVPTHYISDYGHFSACGRNVRFTSNHPEKVDCLLCRKTEGFKEAIAMIKTRPVWEQGPCVSDQDDCEQCDAKDVPVWAGIKPNGIWVALCRKCLERNKKLPVRKSEGEQYHQTAEGTKSGLNLADTN